MEEGSVPVYHLDSITVRPVVGTGSVIERLELAQASWTPCSDDAISDRAE